MALSWCFGKPPCETPCVPVIPPPECPFCGSGLTFSINALGVLTISGLNSISNFYAGAPSARPVPPCPCHKKHHAPPPCVQCVQPCSVSGTGNIAITVAGVTTNVPFVIPAGVVDVIQVPITIPLVGVDCTTLATARITATLTVACPNQETRIITLPCPGQTISVVCNLPSLAGVVG